MGCAALMLNGCASAPSPELTVKPQGSDPQQASDSLEPAWNLAPQWQVGNRWDYSDGYSLKVTEVQGDETTFERTDNSDLWVKRKSLFKIESQSAKVHRKVVFRSQDPATLFPLRAGKKVSFTREYLADGKLKVHQTSWSVQGKETIEVPAGRLNCWILVWETHNENTGWKGYEKWWYSPEIGHYARLEYQYGDYPGSSRVLMHYSPVPD